MDCCCCGTVGQPHASPCAPSTTISYSPTLVHTTPPQELVATTFMGTGALLLFEQARFMQAGSAQLWLPQAGMLVGAPQSGTAGGGAAWRGLPAALLLL